ncbi:MAG: helix-turn-helix transcriptional regulator [Clostridia bacterium]|nr:helix-turn-helix transcriptional regulator [Clostridia bacterium]
MDQKVFAQRLKQLRAAKGVDRQTMSLKLNLTKNYIFNIEAGYAYPSMTNFFAICAFLGCTPAEFFDFNQSAEMSKEQELIEATRNFCTEDMDHLIDYAIKMKW